jgi:hypothetical protein
MRTRTRTLLGGLAAALALASAVGVASAARLSLSNQTFRQVWSPMTISTAAEGGGEVIRCNVTMEGSFHYRTFNKVSRSTIGAITRSIFAHPCTGGEFWAANGTEEAGLGTPVENTLPWVINYEGFEGTLPNITGVRTAMRLHVWRKDELGRLCLYEGMGRATLSLTAGVVRSIVPDPRIELPRIFGSLLCRPVLFLRGGTEVGRYTVLGTTQAVTLTLI